MQGDNELAPVALGTNEPSLWREQPIARGFSGLSRSVSAHTRPVSGHTSGLSRSVSGHTRPVSGHTSGLSRPVSGRISGLRGHLLGQTDTLDCLHGKAGREKEGTRSQPHSRPASGRLTGLRGLLLSQERTGEVSSVTQSSSESDLHRPESRPGTAVLAQGHRPLRVGPLDTDIVPLPAITTEGGGGVVHFAPPVSTQEPQISAHLPHPSSDLEECLASISHFDHTHLGQLGRNSQGTYMYIPTQLS